MQQSQKRKARFILLPAFAAALAIGGIASQVQAEGSSSSAEVQRGIPGVDIDLPSRSQGADVDLQAGSQNDRDAGVPGVDVDTRTSGAGPDAGMPGVDVDTRTSGAASDTGAAGSEETFAPAQDRN